MTGLVLREPELRLVLSAYADDVLLVVQDPGNLARVEACQAIYSAASSAQVSWVKSSGLAVGDWQQLCISAMLRWNQTMKFLAVKVLMVPIVSVHLLLIILPEKLRKYLQTENMVSAA
ncbi:unnamed protein product [Caretta caretta]